MDRRLYVQVRVTPAELRRIISRAGETRTSNSDVCRELMGLPQLAAPTPKRQAPVTVAEKMAAINSGT